MAFSLASFEYSDLFDGVEHVWEVLSLLEAYLMAHTPRENSIRGMVHLGACLMGQHILIEEDAVVEPGAWQIPEQRSPVPSAQDAGKKVIACPVMGG